MAKINLLPWRETQREQNKKNVIVLLISSALLAGAVVFIINYYVGSLLEEQILRNQRLQAEISQLDSQIADIKRLKEVREGLFARMKIVQGLQATRTMMVHLFDELIKVLPDGVYLTDVKRIGDKVTLQGYTESNSNISILMRNIQNSPWLFAPELTEIKKDKEAKNMDNNEFNLNVILKQKNMRLGHE